MSFNNNCSNRNSIIKKFVKSYNYIGMLDHEMIHLHNSYVFDYKELGNVALAMITNSIIIYCISGNNRRDNYPH